MAPSFILQFPIEPAVRLPVIEASLHSNVPSHSTLKLLPIVNGYYVAALSIVNNLLALVPATMEKLPAVIFPLFKFN
jgi:hypothetical protein